MSRTTAHRPIPVFSHAIGFLIWMAAGPLHAQVMYTVAEIASPDGFPLTVTAISEAGHVVGFANSDQNGPYGFPLRGAFTWYEEVWTEIGTLGGEDSAAYGVNSAGQVVGVSDTASGEPHGFLWLPSPAYGLAAGLHDLCPGEGRECYAQDINESGQVLGVVEGESREAFLWLPEAGLGLPGGFNELPSVTGEPAPLPWWSSECAINDAGQCAFGSQVWLPFPAYGRSAGWSAVDVRILSGDEWVTVGRITNQGELLARLSPYYEDRICALSSGECVLLDDGFRPIDINDHVDRAGAGLVFVSNGPNLLAAGYRLSGATASGWRLQNALFPHTGWNLRSADAINNARQIAGTGVSPAGRDSAYRLDPIDADFNDDASVDLADYALWRHCLGGPGVEAPVDCASADLNRDDAVDLIDALAIQRLFTRSP